MQVHLNIAGETKQPQVVFTGSWKDREKLMVCMGMMYGRGAALVELTGTEYEGRAERKTYTTVNGSKACEALGAHEYIDALKALIKHYCRLCPSLRGNPNFAVMHDNARPHIAKVVQDFLKSEGIKVVMVPTRSPDMDPWDYGVFGGFKQSLFRDSRKRKMDWDQQCQEAVKRLKELDKTKLDNAIDELPLRMQACIDVKGQHIENKLVNMKRKK